MNTFAFRQKKSSNYFEGWYIRITDIKKSVNIAVIFGVTNSKHDPHAFIQLFDGVKLTNTYHKFELSDFSYNDDIVSIGNNTLSLNHLTCNLDNIKISADFSHISTLKGLKSNKSAMGFLVKAPLQCFQEVNIMNGSFSAEIIEQETTKKVDGKIYMEKTYGDKFPTKWIWLQCNHFPKDIALTFAYGKIPFLFWKINGFMAILQYQKKEYRFTSYNFSKLSIDNYKPNKVKITLRKKDKVLILDASLTNAVKLVGPNKNGVMNLKVYESISSSVQASFIDNNQVVFDEIGSQVGLEIMNQ